MITGDKDDFVIDNDFKYDKRVKVDKHNSKHLFFEFFKKHCLKSNYFSNPDKTIHIRSIKNRNPPRYKTKVKVVHKGVKDKINVIKHLTIEKKISYCPRSKGLFIPIKLEDSHRFIDVEIDTGSPKCLISPETLKSHVDISKVVFTRSNSRFKSITGHSLDVRYQVKLRISILGIKPFYQTFHITDHVDQILLGRDLLFSNKFQLNFDSDGFSLLHKRNKNNVKVSFVHKDLKVPPHSEFELELDTNGIQEGTYSIKLIRGQNDIRPIDAVYRIGPNDRILKVLFLNRSDFEKNVDIKRLYALIIPRSPYNGKIDISTKFDLCVSGEDFLCRNYNNVYFERNNVNIVLYNQLKDKYDFNENAVCGICVENLSPTDIYTIDIEKYHQNHAKNFIIDNKKKNEEIIKLIQEMDEDVIEFYEQRVPELNADICKPTPQSLLNDIIDEKIKHIPIECRKILKASLLRNNLARSGQYTDRKIGHELHMEFHKPLPKNTKIYPIPFKYQECVFSTLQTLVYNNLLCRAGNDQNFGSPLFVKAKKDGSKLRLLVDLRDYNSCVKHPSNAAMCDSIDYIKTVSINAKYVSQVDLANAYFSIPYSKETFESPFSNILTPFGVFKAKYAVQGNCKVPSFLNSILNYELERNNQGQIQPLNNILKHYDDVNCWSNFHQTILDHVLLTSALLDRLTRIGLSINIDKCTFGVDLTKESIGLLGYQVAHNYISVPPEKYTKIYEHLITPKKIKDLQHIIGLLSYFRNLYDAKQLNKLSTLSSKLKKGALLWDSEGEQILDSFRKAFKEKNISTQLPTTQCLNIIFVDSSDVAGGGLLKFIDLKNIEFPDNKTPHQFTLDDWQKSHAEKYNVEYTNITPYLDIHKLVVYIYDLYTYGDHKNITTFDEEFFNNLKGIDFDKDKESSASTLKSIINAGFTDIFHPLNFTADNLEFQYENYLNFIKQIQDNDFSHMYTDQYLLRSIAKILNRSLLLIIKHSKTQPFTKVSIHDGYLSPILVYYNPENKNFRLMGLLKNFENFQKFNIMSVDKFSAEATFKLYNQINKRNPQLIKCGPTYIKKWEESQKHLSIPVKELFALFYSIHHFSEFSDLSHALVITDSLTVKSWCLDSSNRILKRFNHISMLIQSRFPNIKICHINGKNNIADHLTRLGSLYLVDEEKKVNKINAYELIIEKRKLMEKYCSFEKIAKETLKGHPELYNDSRFTSKNNVLFKNDLIFIPDSLVDLIILRIHSDRNHVGIKMTKSYLHKQYCFSKNKNKIDTRVAEIINICVNCRTNKANNFRTILGSHLNNEYKPHTIIAMDYIELEKRLSNTNYNINAVLVVTDVISGIVQTYFHTRQSSLEVIRSLISFFCSHFKPMVVWSDNGTPFTSKIFKSFLKSFNIVRLCSSPNRSSSHGHVERKIFLLRHVTKLLTPNDDIRQFPLLFSKAASILNNLPKSGQNDIDLTPYNIHKFFNFKKGKNIRWDALLDHLNFDKDEVESFGNKLQSDLEKLRKKIKKELEIKNKNRLKHKFKVNDWVLVKNFKTNKMHQNFLDTPFKVLTVRKLLLTLIDPLTKLTVNRHVADCKLIKLKETNIPVKILEIEPLFSETYINNLRTAAPEIHKKYNLRKNVRTKISYDESDTISSSENNVDFELF